MAIANTSTWRSVPLTVMQPADWLRLAAVVTLAIVLRLLFYTGFFGSDEVTYVEEAVNIVEGRWNVSTYIGSTRYGMNLPLALFVYLFGLSEASANLFPFLCSVGEVAIVFIVARWLWGTRSAVVCGVLLASLPLHVHYAGRIMADSPLAFFLTLSAALLLRASVTKHWSTYFAAGLAWAGSFWVKETVGLLYLPVFLLLYLYLNRVNSRLLWLMAGVGLGLAANCLLMYILAGDPFYLFVVTKSAMARIAGQPVLTDPWFYFRYLLGDIRHTFILGFLAIFGMVVFVVRVVRDRLAVAGTQFVIFWVLSLVGMFSFAVVSFDPVKLVMKQVNYMLVFAGPMALLGGWFLAELPRRIFMPLITTVIAGSTVLAAFEQQAITVFTANSKAADVFLTDHSDAILIGTTNNERAVHFYTLIENQLGRRDRMISFGEFQQLGGTHTPETLSAKFAGRDVFALLDLQTVNWGARPGNIRELADIPPCWTPIAALNPVVEGSGQWVVDGFLAAGVVLPSSFQERYFRILQAVTTPQPASLFKVDRKCLAQSTS